MKTLLQAKKFIKRYRLKERKLSVEVLEEISLSIGYEILFFDPNLQEHINLLEKINMSSYSKNNEAFLCRKEGYKLILVNKYVDEHAKLFLILHELGHIYLNHFNNQTITKKLQDQQADEFAEYILYYQKPNYKYYILIGSFIAIVAACVALSVKLNLVSTPAPEPAQTMVIQSISPSPSPSPIAVNVVIPSEEPAVTPDEQDSVMVSVTKTGDKYHRSDCRYIVGRAIFTLSIEEATNAGYTACTYCRPDEK